MSTTDLGRSPLIDHAVSDWVERQRHVVSELVRVAQVRHRLETELESNFAAELKKAERAVLDAEKLAGRDRDVLVAKLKSEMEQFLASNRERFEAQFQEIKNEYDDVKDRAEYNHKSNIERIKKQLKDERWEAQAIAESAEQGSKERYLEVKKVIEESLGRRDDIDRRARLVLHNLQRRFLASEPQKQDDEHESAHQEEPNNLPDNPMESVEHLLKEAENALNEMSRLTIPKLARADVFCWPFVIAAFALIYPLGLWLGWTTGTLAALAGTLVAGVLFGLWFTRLGTAILRTGYAKVTTKLNAADELRRAYHRRERQKHRKEVAEIRRIHGQDNRTAEQKYNRAKKTEDEEYQELQEEYERKYPSLLAERKTEFESERDRINREYPALIEQARTNAEAAVEKRKQDCARQVADVKKRRADAWKETLNEWTQTLRKTSTEIAAIQAAFDQHFPEWSDPVWQQWIPAEQFPGGIPFGESHLSLGVVPNGTPASNQFSLEDAPDVHWPAAIPFPGGSLVLKAAGNELARANEAVQAVMLRLLTGLPPSKVKFTIIDPVGLGQNFAAFMHLADYDESLVHHRIWTENLHIEKALAELTEHMETVIQKYLRNEFQSIADYNEQAGEVAEPYRYVVVANFPVGFTEVAARRLTSIVQSGERCGVQALVTVDSKQPLPHGVNLNDLERVSTTVSWVSPKDKPAGWVWQDSDFGRLPLKLAQPPDAEFATRLLHQIGAKALAAGRVQVPFEIVAPPDDQWWTGDASQGISVPLGRAGATKLQNLKLGQGTSQHVLIAGRTGSGKSTLLHALVTNLALHYSPKEVEVYLIDFKKGVEFKTYATHLLPHARVIAVESEREFGLSAMQRLDAELKIRGELYRKLGVQDLAGYRSAQRSDPNLPSLPRILLIVDEFQEFFVEDDRVAQEASLLLDRLVRQGRAFGIHVHLGSQTLGGAYSLARSTLGQMAIRIALQCSESDAHLILSEENSAARLLSRPGEAIYNDSNGTLEGNSPFQVVWLPDDRREHYLTRLSQFARQKGMLPASPPIVFEGNAPAEIESNQLLNRALANPVSSPARRLSCWLGDAIAIKDPTSADFHPHSGSHLLIIGQQAESTQAMFATMIASIVAQAGSREDHTPVITLLDGSPVDAPHADLFEKMVESSRQVRLSGMKDFAEAINVVAQELSRRTLAPNQEYPPIFLMIFDLSRFRTLRKPDDDFSFGMSKKDDAPADPSKQLASIVKDGAAVGVHVILWCDTLNNVHRVFDRSSLREFDMRVLFQMSGNDSSTLIDTPAASRLGFHRALFVSEEQGRLEKFRPYGTPTQEWIDRIRGVLERR